MIARLENMSTETHEIVENALNLAWILISLVLAVAIRNVLLSDQIDLLASYQASTWVLLPSIFYILIFSPFVIDEMTRHSAVARIQIYIFHFFLHGLILSATAFIFQEKTFSRLVLFVFLVISHTGMLTMRAVRIWLKKKRSQCLHNISSTHQSPGFPT